MVKKLKAGNVVVVELKLNMMPAGLWEETWVQGENMNIQSYHLGSNLWHSYSNAKTQSLCQRAAQDSWHILKIKRLNLQITILGWKFAQEEKVTCYIFHIMINENK